MLFNSYEFLFGFLPVCLAGFYLLARLGLLYACTSWLTLASLFFYGYWNPKYLFLLLASIVVNFYFGKAISRLRHEGQARASRQVLVIAVTANLATLAYFKYANFFLESMRQFTGLDIPLAGIVLPLGISFFTFTQIAFLVDTNQGKASEPRFVPYALFVTYFPHLIAGPVLHHAEMMPQFGEKSTYRFQVENFAIGVAFFLVGLFKKVVLADEVQPFVGPVFEASPGYTLTMLEAWGGALAYTLQLYFDFSGYSDMAIGLSKMFNVDLPLNFNSPYKAASIIDFWRRWHMTLSRFLRDYLYFGLGGNRKGPVRRHANLLITMLLGGLWHGAGWTFLIWGGVHGMLLVINHGWRHFRERWLGHDLERSSVAGHVAAVLVTFVCVVVAWVFFRATSLPAAFNVLRAMFGWNGFVFPVEWQAALTGSLPAGMGDLWTFGSLDAFFGLRQCVWCGVLLAIVFFVPNSQTLIGRFESALRSRGMKANQWAWCATGFACTLVFVVAAINDSRGVSEFIYFNF